MSVLVEPVHVSAGCNRVVGGLDWGHAGLVAYGSHHAVILYDPQAAKVVATLHGHAATVNCCKWFPQEQHAGVLLSGAADGSIIFWSNTSSAGGGWDCVVTLQALWAVITRPSHGKARLL
ncbi:uncharacterized protein LOC142357761 [Convolutriloba macropyga]|uniref:uncharacterized protein LOC142357761 n=1 Tax=Convolutriloba macropyga TaxID=536237 RepID=UPI003F51EFB0